ncbi:DUF2066 domain-containing protein [Noviluteimonas lactosilytica]|uniref:DUF2066 domain-containing protein n=1 Tax=Noviluteimonas lactosilytica TaxID=2888523 RepID=UPI003CCCCAC2
MHWAFRMAKTLAGVAALWLVLGSAFAQRVEGDVASARGLYEAEVNVNGQGPAERSAGFARAMTQVLGKLTGDRSASSRPGVGQELRRADEYVKSYDYRQDEGRSATGAPTFTTTLIVRFEPEQIDGLAATLGLPVWPEPRPKPVLWLAIDDGRGPRLVALAQTNAARAVLDRALERGYRLGLPSGSAAEQAAVGAIWRGDTAAIARLSSRYSPPMQLIGKLYRAPEGGWTAEWTFVDTGKVLSTWTATQPDARRAMATGADGGADALSKKYAKRSTAAGEPGRYTVQIDGIRSNEDYLRLMSYLQGLPVIRGMVPVRAAPDGLVLELDLLTGMPGLKSTIARGDVLLAEEDTPVLHLR